MKAAIPSSGEGGLDDRVGEHFGRVPTYTLVEPQSMQAQVVENTSHHAGGTKYPPELLAEHGVDTLICKSLGRRAINMFSDMNIQVYCGASGTVRNAVEQWKADQLTAATRDKACTRHEFRGEGRKAGRR